MENTELIYYPVLDVKREKAQEIEKRIAAWLYKDLNITNNEEEATAYLVWWGDGFMLDTIKKKYDFEKSPEENKLFFWVNCGTLWFLLNPIDEMKKLPKSIDDVEVVKAHLMKVDILKTNGQREIKHAINDVDFGRKMSSWFRFDVTWPTTSEHLVGTGLLITTTLGSSAYWLNNQWPLMPAESKIWWISGLATLPFIRKVIKPEDINVKIKWRYPAMVHVDGEGWEVENVQEVDISPTEHYAKILFPKWTSFDTKRLLLAEQKLLRVDF